MIGQILKAMRLNKGFKQSDLAARLNIAQTTLSGYETSYSNPRFEIIEQLANQCGYEVIFRNMENKTELTSKTVGRLDI